MSFWRAELLKVIAGLKERQPLDATLTTIAGLTGAADKGIYFTDTDTAALFDLTAAGRAILDDASAAAQRTTLGLGTAAVKNTGTSGNVVPLLDGSPLTLTDSLNRQFQPQISVVNNYNGVGSGYILFQKSRSGGPVQVGDPLGNFLGQGVDSGSVIRNAAFFTFTVTDVGAAYVSAKIDFSTDQAGSTATRMTVQRGMTLGAATGGDKSDGTVNVAGGYYVNGILISPPGSPVTKNADFTVAATETNIIVTKGSSCTATLPAAASFPGREIEIKTTVAFTTVSASSNVVPKAGGAAGTAILAGVAGTWARLVSDGTNWIVMSGT